MKFTYQARNKEGEVQSGVVEASSRDAALDILDQYGLYVTLVEEAESQPLFSKRITWFDRVSKKDVMLFSRQLAIMFKAEVSLVESLRAIAQQAGADFFKEKIHRISENVEGGTAFSDALAKHPDAFSAFYINMVKSGEASGTLSSVLAYLADHEEREYELSSKVKGAFLYPAFVIFIAGAVLFMMMAFVIPNITKIIAETGQELPAITKVVVFLSDLVRGWWWLLLLLAAAGGAGFWRYIHTPKGRRRYNALLLKIPVVGTFLKMVYLSRFAENLSTLVSGGIPIVQALDITGRIVGNETYQEIIGEAQDRVKQGEQISSVLARHPAEFPPIFVQMVSIGERSGSLDETLGKVVEFYRKEVERNIESFLGLLEPALIVVLGLAVGGMMAAVLLPLYQSVSF